MHSMFEQKFCELIYDLFLFLPTLPLWRDQHGPYRDSSLSLSPRMRKMGAEQQPTCCSPNWSVTDLSYVQEINFLYSVHYRLTTSFKRILNNSLREERRLKWNHIKCSITTRVGGPTMCSVLRIQPFPSYGLGSFPGLRTSVCQGVTKKRWGAKKKVIKDNKTKKVKNVDIKTTISLITLDEHGLSKAIQGQRSSE